MRDTGDMYYLGARILEEKRKAMVVERKVAIEFAITQPLVTVSAVACEIYLKMLITNKLGKLPPKGHKLKKLYEQLTEEQKKHIEDEFNKWIEDRSDFETEIAQIDNSFLEWRYLYEKGWIEDTSITHIRIGSIVKLMEILHDMCHSLKLE
jgi:HEPN domain-containing protein